MQHTCPPRQEIHEMKAKLREVRSRQDEMFKLMQNMMSSLVRLERNMAQRSEGSHHASSDQEVQAEIVVAGGFMCKSVEVFNMATKTWRPLSQMNECRNGASAVLYQDRMIVTGGKSGSFQFLDSVEEVNLTQQDAHWVESQFKLPVPSRGHTCLVYQNRLLLIGGLKHTVVLNTIYEIQLKPPYTSRLLTKMPRPICDHCAEIVNGKIYIIGGSTTGGSGGTSGTVLTFDPASNTFTELKPLPYAVSHMATTTWKDNVVVVGGVDNKRNTRNTVILYNVATGSHRMLPEMTKKRSGCTAVTIGDNVVAIGGWDETGKSLNSVEYYNFHTNTWTEFPAMTEARAYHTSVVKYC